jgi:AraC-like DNA-binding protein
MRGPMSEYSEQRKAVAKLMLELVTEFHRFYHMNGGFVGKEGDLFFPTLVVYISEMEGQPMSATKVAAYLGMHRSTVRRRLQALVHMKVLKEVGPHRTKYVLHERVAQAHLDPRFQRYIHKCFRIISEAHQIVQNAHLSQELH